MAGSPAWPPRGWSLGSRSSSPRHGVYLGWAARCGDGVWVPLSSLQQQVHSQETVGPEGCPEASSTPILWTPCLGRTGKVRWARKREGKGHVSVTSPSRNSQCLVGGRESPSHHLERPQRLRRGPGLAPGDRQHPGVGGGALEPPGRKRPRLPPHPCAPVRRHLGQ